MSNDRYQKMSPTIRARVRGLGWTGTLGRVEGAGGKGKGRE